MKPIIGINVDIKKGPPPEASLQTPYLESIHKSGGIPLMIPPMSDDDVQAVLAKIDGIMFIGGADYSPKRYNEEPDETVKLIDSTRDDFDFRLLKNVLDRRDMPILGICLGCQLLNVGLGGSLIQDIKKRFPQSEVMHASPNGWQDGFNRHDVNLVKGTRVHEIYGIERLTVSTSHHQAVNAVGKGLTVAAHCDDGVIEAVELPDRRFVIGVQWHPERDYDGSKNLFDKFVAVCANGHK